MACIGLGSNVGDRRAHLAMAREELGRLAGTELVAFSGVYETEPVGPAGPGRFLNAAAVVRTELGPKELLGELLRIERLAGRERHQRWAPRTLDLDLLLYGDRVMEGEGLVVPHPRMAERRFVLEPLAEVAGEVRHPVLGRTIGELLAELGGD